MKVKFASSIRIGMSFVECPRVSRLFVLNIGVKGTVKHITEAIWCLSSWNENQYASTKQGIVCYSAWPAWPGWREESPRGGVVVSWWWWWWWCFFIRLLPFISSPLLFFSSCFFFDENTLPSLPSPLCSCSLCLLHRSAASKRRGEDYVGRR